MNITLVNYTDIFIHMYLDETEEDFFITDLVQDLFRGVPPFCEQKYVVRFYKRSGEVEWREDYYWPKIMQWIGHTKWIGRNHTYSSLDEQIENQKTIIRRCKNQISKDKARKNKWINRKIKSCRSTNKETRERWKFNITKKIEYYDRCKDRYDLIIQKCENSIKVLNIFRTVLNHIYCGETYKPRKVLIEA